MQNSTTGHGSGDGDYEWAVQNMLLDECLAEEEDGEEEYVDYTNDDSVNVATAISGSTAASTWATWTGSANESGGIGRGLSFPNNPAASIKARGGIKRRSRTSRASSVKTTVVKANPTNFRALVQQFTGCHSQFPHPSLPLKGKGPINLNFAQYTVTTPTPTPSTITHFSRNISTSSHPPHGIQQQQGSLATANNNNNNNNDVTVAGAGAGSASDHLQSPPPPPFTSFSSDHDEIEQMARELSTVWETHDQYHYANWNNH